MAADQSKKTPVAFLRLQEDAETALRDAAEKVRRRFGFVPKRSDVFRYPSFITNLPLYVAKI